MFTDFLQNRKTGQKFTFTRTTRNFLFFVSMLYHFRVVKGVLQRTFLFQLTNDLGLCTSFTKLIIILFLSKAVFIKKKFVISIFCAKNRTTINVLF